MRYRLLGRTGLRVSEMFLGTMTFGQEWGWGASVEECRKMFTAYAEAGGNVIDTANRYTEGSSERIVKELLGSDRDRFVLATKYTLTMDGTDPNAAGNHRKNLVRSVEASLGRLGTDYIDLLWVHIWDPNTPVEETMRALDDLVRAGKVLYVGMSDAPAWLIARANTIAEFRGWTPFAGLQLPYSLLQRDIERELLPMAAALELSVAAWSPLAGGVLSGKFTRSSAGGPSRVDRATVSERDLAIARTVDEVADELGVSSSQVAIAWTRAHRPWIHPILGARDLDQLTDNLAAIGLELPEEAVTRLEEAAAIELGFPMEFILNTTDFVYGASGNRVDGRPVG
ncbi:oxidoreductase [Sphaerisporangium melleum]|uniref:Oxidoreductase n=1 Tax=Sphaerisporangium melleum TaxID=321316 RepID=A0A917RMI4_9ACTN|nr:aldo/keto reductase [Sphaerisporangium melleum]GGL14733.1 oxidoreductase [Sphaerisporangium melleum]GII69385.1 oxidoreductase [Sphaerisporangium melleum]